ncbi:uracil phosphoribosyltransferase [Actinotignum urinale]|uniref:Uracil phosphoribosyltransferase n=1 Tax=Actinotignum urinale TaxID=190146 RepID=A0AAW9HRX0_9ACTO|nr:uracil phosphoribosyltransferase [Actinotignum urinale]MDY5154419.1 uracil phosphoribosyltransferase [Actinotignum urinale]
MEILEINHPLVDHKLTVLRDLHTPSATFRLLVEELVTLLAYEATRDVHVKEVGITTPVTATTGVKIAAPAPIVVPILRAGLGMLEGMTKLVPTAEVGFLGLQRDEETLEVSTYANRLPDVLTDRQCFVLDPMLATGHTIVDSVHYLLSRGARDVTVICILATPEGLKTVAESLPDDAHVRIVVASIDEGLNDRGYIVPGLGDAGDRLYGVID